MTLSRRTFVKGAATAAATAAAVATAGPAVARPIPDGTSSQSPIDKVAALKYKKKVPEVFAVSPTAPSHVPAIVIGTGFGGSVAALRLGQAGVRTVMLERGLPWPRDPWRQIFSSELIPDGRALWHRRKFTGVSGIPTVTDSFGGVLDATDYENIQVWRGAAVGGGSVVFAGMIVQPERRFFDAVFSGRVDYDEMDTTYYPLVRKMFKASTIPEDVMASGPFGHSRLWESHAIKAGYTPQRIESLFDWDVVRSELSHQSRKSATVSESSFGNSNGAKYDLTLNYLPQAVATGKVSIHHGHVVRSIGQDKSGRYTIAVDVVDPTGRTLRSQVLTCDKLFLGAGSIGTSELLVRAKATKALPNLTSAVGQGWGTNGDAALVRTLSLHKGLTQAAPCTSRILDETGPLPVTLETFFVPGVPVNIGLLGSLGMTLDPARASFRYDAGSDDVILDWPKGGNDATIAALRRVHDKIATANNVPTGLKPLAPDVNASFTAHPLGGAVLGEATDGYGRVHGYKGLYVVDGAAMPGSSGTVNPVLTITALAERTMAAVIGDQL